MDNEMKFCPNCGSKMENGVCATCSGNTVMANQAAPQIPYQQPQPVAQQPQMYQQPKQTMQQPQMYQQQGVQQLFSGMVLPTGPQEPENCVYVSPDEEAVFNLGSGYLGTFLAGGGMAKASATITNKRVYFKGDSYVSMGVGLKRCKTTQIVDLKDITGVGIYRSFNLGALIFWIICTIFVPIIAIASGADWVFSLLILTLTFILLVFATAKTLLRVEFAGGAIAMDVKGFSKNMCNEFRTHLFRAKDAITKY